MIEYSVAVSFYYVKQAVLVKTLKCNILQLLNITDEHISTSAN